MIPHKYCKYRAILDLSFYLKMNGYNIPPINEATKICSAKEASNQIGTVLLQIIKALAEIADDPTNVMFAKVDIKDRFWRMVYQSGQEWNFKYVLPTPPNTETKIVVPSAL
mmetsp:Transcript_29878/g.62420  ORF Transcript_29878/g.62420 Transcript_29878/m.62420 type:complete len:111 (+) Transcript_29878:4074-4406(+)